MADKKFDNAGWTGDLWEGVDGGRAANDPWADQRSGPKPATHDVSGESRNAAGRDRAALSTCQLLGLISLFLAVVTYMGPGPVTWAVAVVLEIAGKKSGKKAQVSGNDSSSVRAGLVACRISKILCIVYFILMAVGIAFLAIVFGGMAQFSEIIG